MGMQIHFTKADLPENTGVDYIKHEDGTWSATLRFPDGGAEITVATFENNYRGFWFDCGRANMAQMHMITVLIRNRVCFQAS